MIYDPQTLASFPYPSILQSATLFWISYTQIQTTFDALSVRAAVCDRRAVCSPIVNEMIYGTIQKKRLTTLVCFG